MEMTVYRPYSMFFDFQVSINSRTTSVRVPLKGKFDCSFLDSL